jgi:NAD(P)-dependent dehydrogenase (short-subunit alcohol dehydrogenase family)
MDHYAGKRVLVVGGSRGIGRALALLRARRGSSICLVSALAATRPASRAGDTRSAEEPRGTSTPEPSPACRGSRQRGPHERHQAVFEKAAADQIDLEAGLRLATIVILTVNLAEDARRAMRPV